MPPPAPIHFIETLMMNMKKVKPSKKFKNGEYAMVTDGATAQTM